MFLYKNLNINTGNFTIPDPPIFIDKKLNIEFY